MTKPKAPKALCNECPYLYQPVVLSSGPKKATHCVVGMAPHTNEVKYNLPFIGDSGKLLEAALVDAGVKREDVLITNTVLCKPTVGTDPDPEAVACCRPRLQAELATAEVKYVLAMGRQPREALLPESVNERADNYQGVWHNDGNGLAVLSTYHPAYVLRGQEAAYVDVLADVYKFFHTKPFVHDFRYVALQTHEDLKALVAALARWPESACLDLETTNVDMERSAAGEWWNGYVLCMGVSWKPGMAFVIPEQLFNSRTSLTILKPALEREAGWYGHNIKFDSLYLMRYYDGDLNLRIADDTILMHFALDERSSSDEETSGGAGGAYHNLKRLAGLYFDVPNYDAEIHRYLKKPKTESYSHAPRELLYKYVAMDVDITTRLKQQLEPALKAESLYDTPYRMILVPAMQALTLAERAGFKISRERLENVKAIMASKVDELHTELCDIAGHELNTNSPAQVAEVLYDQLRFKTPKGRKIKERSTNKEVLQKLKGQHPFIDTLLEYRRWAKLYGTYATKLDQYVDPQGRAHFEFNLTGTVTGRVEAGLLLTIPRAYTPEGKMIRECFVAEDGYIIVAGDYSQAELRWLGWYAQEPFLFDVYDEHDRDLHSEAARRIFGENYTKEQRMYTKMLNFSFAYGGTEHSFAEDSGLPINEARAIVHEYNENMPCANAWKDAQVALIKRQGWIRSATGRRRRFPLITQRNAHDVRTRVVNFPVQSVANDATLMAFSRVTEWARSRRLDVKPLLPFHDGVYFEVRNEPELVQRVGKAIHNEMMNAVRFIMSNAGEWFEEFKDLKPMPFKIDIDSGLDWGNLSQLEV